MNEVCCTLMATDEKMTEQLEYIILHLNLFMDLGDLPWKVLWRRNFKLHPLPIKRRITSNSNHLFKHSLPFLLSKRNQLKEDSPHFYHTPNGKRWRI